MIMIPALLILAFGNDENAKKMMILSLEFFDVIIHSVALILAISLEVNDKRPGIIFVGPHLM